MHERIRPDTFAGMETREQILRAARDIYAQFGFRGATTRRIADAAGVNEVTVFRHFGSKDALLIEALRLSDIEEEAGKLPNTPGDPGRELTEWASFHFEKLRRLRSMIRTCMGELEERPEFAECARTGPHRLFEDLCRYLAALRDEGRVDAEADVEVAAAMLMGALFHDAMARDVDPDRFPSPIEDAPRRYVEMTMRALTVGDHAAIPDATGA